MRIFCIGMNYASHIAELGNSTPTSPVIFIKPSSALLNEGEYINFPSHGNELHHEAEIVVQIGKDGKNIPINDAKNHISALSIGLDLTLRDLQRELKKEGHPWEKAKAFDGSAPLGKLIPFTNQDLTNLHIACKVNGKIRQDGNSSSMLHSITNIISYISSIWQLQKGDLIFTGTPEGVGPLNSGDTIEIFSLQLGSAKWFVK